MARVRYSSLVSGISGSVGGATFQLNPYGNTLRSKPNPIRGRSLSQLLVRQYMKAAHDAWANMTPAGRLQWQQFISFSNQKIRRDHNVLMSGHGLFIKYQTMRQLAGLAIQTTLQYISIPTWYYPVSIALDAPAMTVLTNAVPETPMTDIFFILKLSAPRPASQSFNPRGLRYITPAWADWYELALSNYVTIFGAYSPNGSIVHYTFQAASTLTPVFSNLRSGLLTVTQI